MSTHSLGVSFDGAPAVPSPYSKTVWYLLVVFIFSVPAEAALVIPGIGSLSRAVGAVLTSVVLLDLLTRPYVVRPSGVSLLAAAFTAWAGLSAAWSLDPKATLIRAATYLQLAVMFWIILDNARSSRRCLTLLAAYTLGVLFIAIATIVTFRAISLAALTTTDLRVSAFGVNPNEHGLTMVAALPWALHFARVSHERVVRLLFAATFCIAIVAVVLTASRGAFAALAVSALGFAWMLSDARLGMRLLMAAVAAATVFALTLLVPEMIWHRLGSLGSKLQSMDLNNRMAAWQAGIRYFVDQPIQGVGAGGFIEATTRVINIPRSSHNTFLGVLVETGVVGGVIFGVIIWAALRSAWCLPGAWRRAALTTLVPMFVGMLVLGWDHRKVPWLFLALIIAFAAAVASEERPPVTAR